MRPWVIGLTLIMVLTLVDTAAMAQEFAACWDTIFVDQVRVSARPALGIGGMYSISALCWRAQSLYQFVSQTVAAEPHPAILPTRFVFEPMVVRNPSSLFGPNLAKTKILAKSNTVNQLDHLHGSAKPAHAARE